jgi:hypothetical protein
MHLGRIQKAQGMSDERMDEILQAHLIDPTCLRSDDFETFLEMRRAALATRIEAAMGKPIQRDIGSAPPVLSNEYEQDDELE